MFGFFPKLIPDDFTSTFSHQAGRIGGKGAKEIERQSVFKTTTKLLDKLVAGTESFAEEQRVTKSALLEELHFLVNLLMLIKAKTLVFRKGVFFLLRSRGSGGGVLLLLKLIFFTCEVVNES